MFKKEKKIMPNLLDTVRHFSKAVVDGRTKRDIHNHLMSETNELHDEIVYDDAKWGPAGPDGIMGESIDVILCALDLIFKDKPDITNDEIEAYVLMKLEKWKRKSEAGEYK